MAAPIARLARLAFAFAACLAATSCSRTPDAEQESICRRLIPALYDSPAGVTILSSESGGAGVVFLRFRLGAGARQHSLACRFAGSGLSLRKRELVGVSPDGRPAGPAALFFLKERWLETQASVVEAPRLRPAPLIGWEPGPALSYATQQTLSALPKTGILVLVAAAYALLYGLIGRINLAFGAYAALGGVAAILAITALDLIGVPSLPWGLAIGVCAALALSALFSVVAAQLVVAPLAERPGQHLLVASAGLMLALEEFLRLTQGANTRWLSPVFNAPITIARGAFDITVTVMALAATLVAATAALGLLLWLSHSRFGRDWRALAEEPVAAALCGVDGRRVLVATFALASALAGLAGVLVATHYGGIGFAGGGMLGLTALVAAILGGIGSVGGAMLGALVIGALEAGWSATMPIEQREIVIFALLAALLALKPDGLLGGRTPGPMRV